MHGHQGRRGTLPLPKHESDRDGYTHDERRDDMRWIPGIFAASPVQAQQQHRRTTQSQTSTYEINRLQLQLPVTRHLPEGHEEEHGQDRDSRQWQIKPENPSPGILVDGGQRTTNDRTDSVGNGHHGTQDALVFTTFAQRNDVADDHLGHGH